MKKDRVIICHVFCDYNDALAISDSQLKPLKNLFGRNAYHNYSPVDTLAPNNIMYDCKVT